MLIELQALMDKAAGNNPRRLTVGLEANRLAMLLAVLSRYGRVPVHDYDVFANAVGGIKAAEPAADLPLLFSLISSVRGVPLPAGLACFGEIGLTGEVRPVQRAEERIREAIKQGFSRIIVPQRNVPKALALQPGVSVVGVRNAVEAIEQLSAWEQPNAGTGGKRGKRSTDPVD